MGNRDLPIKRARGHEAGQLLRAPASRIDRGQGLNGCLNLRDVQVTKVRSLTLALLHNSIRFAILAYVIVVVFWQHSGYQVSEDGVGSVQVDVRGVSFTHWHKDDSDDLRAQGGWCAALDACGW